MKKDPRDTLPSSSVGFERKLESYSTLSAVAVAAVGVTATVTASAQAMANFTISGTLGGSLHTLTVPATAAAYPAGVTVFSFVPAGFTNNNHLGIGAAHYLGNHGSTTQRLNVAGGFGIDNSTVRGPGDPIPLPNGGGGVVFSRFHFGGINSLSGAWQPVAPAHTRTGYVGFRLSNGGQNYYGWLNLKVTSDVNGHPATISFWDRDGDGVFGAYGLPGVIHVGDLAAVPEPASVATGLALFALGAAGVREHRKRKAATTSTAIA